MRRRAAGPPQVSPERQFQDGGKGLGKALDTLPARIAQIRGCADGMKVGNILTAGAA